MANSQELVQALKKGLREIKNQYLSDINEELEKDITQAVLFASVYTVEEVKTPKGIKHRLVDMQGLHDVQAYENVRDFLYCLTGNDKEENYGFETYYLKLKKEWNEAIFSLLDNYLNTKNPELMEVEISDDVFSSIFTTSMEKWWEEILQQNLKDVVTRHYKAIWQEVRLEDEQEEMEYWLSARQALRYESLLADWTIFSYPERNVSITTTKPETIVRANAWAARQTLTDLDIFDMHHIKEPEIQNLKWLNAQTLRDKKHVAKQASVLIDKVLESVNATPILGVNKKIRQIYDLREDIFNLPGERFLQIESGDKREYFFLDEFNRVNNGEQSLIEMTNMLEAGIDNVGAIMVRQKSEDTYTTLENGKPVRKNFFNIYGVLMCQGSYRGLNAKEMHEIYVYNQETGEYLGEEEGTRFYDWAVGDQNSPHLHPPRDRDED